MENPYSPDPKVLNAVRSPLGMAALIVSVLTLIMGGVLATGLPNEVKEVCLAFYFIGVMGCGAAVYHMARKDQRGLAYGPNELIEESRFQHLERMAMRQSK
uniref:Uncharacterized protein n=1 Tax=mine drainage metagenome TaxID=410659 RepID=E6QIN8_9ZZZZ